MSATITADSCTVTPVVIIIAFTALLLLWPLLLRYRRDHRHAQLRQRPFPQEWIEILNTHVPLYCRLPSTLREQLHGHIQILLDEKHFHGAGGLKVTQTMRLTIMAQAALLLLNRRSQYFPSLYSIVLHPAAFVVNREHWDAAGLHHHDEEVLSGESWESGQLVLSWDDTLAGGMACGDGYNVVLHEFTHQLDLGTGHMNGTPKLDSGAQYQAWDSAFTPAYKDHCARVDAGMRTWLDPYAAIEPAEFFAVLTEAFFELPGELLAEYPDIYACLRGYYRIDPLHWA